MRRVLAALLASASLPQQIPRLVELAFQRLEPEPILAVEPAAQVTVAESPLLRNQIVDVVEDRLVVHSRCPSGIRFRTVSATTPAAATSNPTQQAVTTR